MSELAENHPYRQLEEIFRRIGALSEAEGILHWDMSAMMPAGAAEGRAEQLSALKLIRHELLTAPEMGALLDEAESAPPEESWQAANLHEMRRTHVHSTAIESRLVAALTQASSRCEMIWRDARPANDFAAVVEPLQALLDLVREKAAAKAEPLDCSPYEALMDQFEPGCRISDIDRLFDDLAGFLPDILAGALDRQSREPAPILPEGPFSVEAQRQLGLSIMKRLGFDFNHGRLDVSLHPFCGGVPDDVRITTRYDETDFAQSLMGVLHETGHALYERGLPSVWRLQPVGSARGMAMHESQSLLVEMQVCRGSHFLKFATPLIRAAFGRTGDVWSEENLTRLYARVAPDFIRVDADEVTYPFHVILRYRLETALISGDLDVADLPGAWNDAMQDLLGLKPATDTDGCLQDIHWYSGSFGYFPTYTMGAMAAAQIYSAAISACPQIPDCVASGDFAPLMGWLRTEIHGQASNGSTDDILMRATGAPLSAAAFRSHLERRYLG